MCCPCISKRKMIWGKIIYGRVTVVDYHRIDWASQGSKFGETFTIAEGANNTTHMLQSQKPTTCQVLFLWWP